VDILDLIIVVFLVTFGTWGVRRGMTGVALALAGCSPASSSAR